MRLFRFAAAFALCALAIVPVAWADQPVPEPGGYRTSDYKTATPATLDGKPALTVAETHDLWQKKAAVFIDVLPQVPKPAGLTPGTIWRDKPRLDISGSVWLPDTGYGALAPAMEDYFRRGLKQASGGDLNKPLVFYCLRHCWMSWNAAKRAKALGYTHVLWYADGTQGWSEAGYPLTQQKPVPRP
ncbi:rhodanese [Methylovirgula ligni]|uniref:PQQ-dependent catabolism-associated CXXCW motif protein n=1 Tax=Methylovirgula ligni TaxID=569860 RepID=A0A3D9Z718_9HYPH|nr:PQQ-dependent catabolism-associated CXXCW motif protein [Methylovirgula ligni]QAY95359.1 rhodanese [Methylovirgula ligni]REF89329.1 PQQ-dependent catabolism-associated CXXCW motif protein [Methylovirgula ligni]